VLAVDGLTKAFGGFTAVADVALSVEAGVIHAVIAPNGAGKTTLFNLIIGVLAPSAGRLVFGRIALSQQRSRKG
jgi:branched-chain amino acid transport system ATP-binding protein